MGDSDPPKAPNCGKPFPLADQPLSRRDSRFLPELAQSFGVRAKGESLVSMDATGDFPKDFFKDPRAEIPLSICPVEPEFAQKKALDPFDSADPCTYIAAFTTASREMMRRRAAHRTNGLAMVPGR